MEMKCARCHGRGEVLPYCPWCEDSTHGHECPGPVSCGECGGTGALDSPPRTGLTGIAGLEAEMRDRLAEKDRQIAALTARAQAAEARVAELEGLHFVVWNGTPSDRTRIWMLEGETALAEIEQVAGGWRWIWWGKSWHKAKTHTEARDALLALRAKIRAEQAAKALLRHAGRGE